MSKHQLTISPSYVSDWTYVEAIRELFQNALDNQVAEEGNDLYFNYNEEEQQLTIGNKTSLLEINSLLMGYSTKRDDEKTIGRHGEGYKVALMVLLREGKRVTVANFGKKELWNIKFIKSRTFNGEMITEVNINKNHIFKKTPHNNLEFIIDGITAEEYANLVKYNLNLQESVDGVEFIGTPNGDLLLKEEERGNLYVSGLFITNNEKLTKGYNFKPASVKLDRDRRLIPDFDLYWTIGEILRNVEDTTLISQMILDGVDDIRYLRMTRNHDSQSEKLVQIKEKVKAGFIATHGVKAAPFSSNDTLKRIAKDGVTEPVMVHEEVFDLLEEEYSAVIVEKEDGVKLFRAFFNKIEGKLSDEERDEMEYLITSFVKSSDVPF